MHFPKKRRCEGKGSKFLDGFLCSDFLDSVDSPWSLPEVSILEEPWLPGTGGGTKEAIEGTLQVETMPMTRELSFNFKGITVTKTVLFLSLI